MDDVTVTSEVAASGLRVGDRIVLPAGRVRRVLAVTPYLEETGSDPGERLEVIVQAGGSATWEGPRSHHSGARSGDLAEQMLRPFRPDELVRVERGHV